METKKIVMNHVMKALHDDDIKMVERIFSRLSADRLEPAILQLVEKAFDEADEASHIMAARFCKNSDAIHSL